MVFDQNQLSYSRYNLKQPSAGSIYIIIDFIKSRHFHIVLSWQNSNTISIKISKTYTENFSLFAKFYMIISRKKAPKHYY